MRTTRSGRRRRRNLRGGFVHNGEFCEPVLPNEPCAPGEMDCGAAPWGDIPVESDTEYVDRNYAAGDSDGSAQKPWTTLVEAFNAAAPNAIVAVAAGSYPDFGIARSHRGARQRRFACGALAPTGTELRDLASVGGVVITGSENVVVNRVWIHDTAALPQPE